MVCYELDVFGTRDNATPRSGTGSGAAMNTISTIVVKVRHPSWARTHYFSIGDGFSARVSDAKRFDSMAEAEGVAKELNKLHESDAYAFWAGRLYDDK